jgi:hypothetical protein
MHACVCVCVYLCVYAHTHTHLHTHVGGSHQGRGERSEISAHGHGALVRNMLEMDKEMDKGSTAVDTTAADNLNDLNRNKDREKTQQVPSRVCAFFCFSRRLSQHQKKHWFFWCCDKAPREDAAGPHQRAQRRTRRTERDSGYGFLRVMYDWVCVVVRECECVCSYMLWGGGDRSYCEFFFST